MRFGSKPESTGGGYESKVGRHTFRVAHAVEKVSKNGNGMMQVRLEFDIGFKDPISIREYLVDHPKMVWKVKKFCESVGLEFGEDEMLPGHLVGLQGEAELILGEANEEGKRYLEVGKFLPKNPSAAQSTAAEPSQADDPGDDIPF